MTRDKARMGGPRDVLISVELPAIRLTVDAGAAAEEIDRTARRYLLGLYDIEVSEAAELRVIEDKPI